MSLLKKLSRAMFSGSSFETFRIGYSTFTNYFIFTFSRRCGSLRHCFNRIKGHFVYNGFMFISMTVSDSGQKLSL